MEVEDGDDEIDDVKKVVCVIECVCCVWIIVYGIVIGNVEQVVVFVFNMKLLLVVVVQVLSVVKVVVL